MDITYRSARSHEVVAGLRTGALWLVAMTLAGWLGMRLPHDPATVAWYAWGVAVLLLALYQPRWGLYLLVVGTMLIEQDNPVGGLPLFNAQIPFFWDSKSFTSVPLAVSPAEVLLVAVLIGWFVHGLRRGRDWRLRANPLLVPALGFGAVLVLGAAHGVLTHGDFKVALWEIRGPTYTVALVLLVPALVRHREHLNRIIWLLILGIIAIAFEGLYVAGAELGWKVTQVESLVGHDDAVNLAFALVLLAALVVIGGSPWQKRTLLAAVPLLVYVLVATQRRDALVVLMLGVALVVMLRVREHPAELRRYVGLVVLVLVAYGLIFAAAHGRGLVYEPVRAVISSFHPTTARDIASNDYRKFERLGLRRTIKGSPIFGVGFGKEYDVPPQVFYIGVPLYKYITHDDMLRMWAKLGTVGFAVYWLFSAAVLAQGALVYRTLKDEGLKAIAAFAVAVVAMQLVVHTVDMAMTFYRSMLVVGLVIGCMLSLLQIERSEAPR
jgi:hypothetical protein